MDLSQLYAPALDEYVPEALDFLSKFSFDSMANDMSTPEGLAQARDLDSLGGDLNDLCPALFTVGTLDYLYDDSLFMAARWRTSGNPSELAIFPASPHGFTVFPTKMTRAANDRTDAWLAQVLEGTDS
ncbi:MAG: alpha/beta hydrolase fold domain-containing protein [bacterium]|nr:alpha/beta hydrolase fold domain-containing protein [bacterium]